MKKRNYLLLLLCIISFTSFAQIGNWRFHYAPSGVVPWFYKIGKVEVNDSDIMLYKGNQLTHFSLYGEKIAGQTVVDANGISTSLHDIYSRQIDAQPIRITAKAGFGNGVLILNALNTQTQDSSFVEINDAIHYVESYKRLYITEADNGDFIVFGIDNIVTCRLEDDLSWTILSSVEHDFNDISSVLKSDDKFVVNTLAGEISLLNADFSTIWTQNTNHPLNYVIQSSGGYVVCGTDYDSETAFVSKINAQGDLVWQENFENRAAHTILALNNGELLIGGINVYCLDHNGNFLWDRNIPTSNGIFDMAADAYNGIILKSGFHLYRLDLNRSTHFGAYNSINTSETEANIGFGGNLDYDNGSISYPLGSGKSPVFTNSPVLTAKTASDSLIGLADFYGQQNTYMSLPQNSAIQENYVWKITQKEIDILQERFNNGEELAPYSHAMLTYPALGNPHCSVNGVAYAIEEALAPFVDMNGDGIYNIFDGDYPEMKGDQMIWWAKRDPVNMLDIHGRWYVYDCGDHLVSKTIYVDYTIINRSGGQLNECRFGNFIDWDLGCQIDDFIGSLPTANAMYTYNEDAIDGTIDSLCYFEVLPYDEGEIPINSFSFLSEDMASAMVYANAGVSNLTFPIQVTDPNTIAELNHYMHAAYRDGTPLTRGGIGYNPASTDFSNYAFPDNPADPTGWSMVSENFNPSDIRALTSSSSFELAPDERKSFTFSFTSHPNIPHPAPDVSGVEDNILAIDELYQAGNNFAPLHLGEDIMIQSGESIELTAGEEGMSYLWSTGETTASISIDTPGTYSVSLTDDNGCQRTDDIVVELATTSTEELVDSKALMHIYPNPMRQGNTATIELEQAQHIASVHIFNTLGQQLSSQLVDDFSARIQVNELAQLPAGVYVLEVIFKNNERQLGKLVIE